MFIKLTNNQVIETKSISSVDNGLSITDLSNKTHWCTLDEVDTISDICPS